MFFRQNNQDIRHRRRHAQVDRDVTRVPMHPLQSTRFSCLLLNRHDGAVWCVSWVLPPSLLLSSTTSTEPSSLPPLPPLTSHPQAHPKFGVILASSSYDGRVLIWRSTPTTASSNSPSTFQKVFESTLHTASVNLLAWAPHECGCLLACASSDGSISVLEFQDGSWGHVILNGAHGLGVNSVSWAPSARPGSLVSASPEKGALRRFVSGGSDCLIKIWDWR